MPPLAVSVADAPLQIETPEPALIAGNGLTVTVTVALFVHPLLVMPVTVYVLVVVGLAITVAPVVAERPVAGDHA
jgi:hypothetical protein